MLGGAAAPGPPPSPAPAAAPDIVCVGTLRAASASEAAICSRGAEVTRVISATVSPLCDGASPKYFFAALWNQASNSFLVGSAAAAGAGRGAGRGAGAGGGGAGRGALLPVSTKVVVGVDDERARSAEIG